NEDATYNGNAKPLPDFVTMTGFSVQEDLARWTDGNQAKIKFPNIFKDGTQVSSITFKASPLLATFEDFQAVTVSLNGKKQEEFVFAYNHTPDMTVHIPYGTTDAEIQFDIPHAKSPGLQDARLLGLSFLSATLTCLLPLQEVRDDDIGFDFNDVSF